MIRVFRVFVPSTVIALLLSEVILIYAWYVVATFTVLSWDPQSFLFHENGWMRIAIVVFSIVLGIYFCDLYTQFRITSKFLLMHQLGVVVGVAFLVQALLSYLRLGDLVLPKWVMIAGSSLALVVLLVWRISYNSFVFKVMGSEGVLFLGTSSASREIGRYLTKHPETGFKVLGFVDNAEGVLEPFGCNTLGPISQLGEIVNRLKPDRIVVGMSERRQRLPVDELLTLRLSGIPIEDALSTFEATLGRICTRELRPSQLVFWELGPKSNRVMLQSIYSMAIAMIATVITSPIMLLVVALVKLTSAGPALFHQTRVGKDGKVFTIYKFRSMYRDAEARSGAVWAKRNDPRITPIGRWLRLLRLDELPQLFNVLKGDMSIVGPRPERPEFVAALAERIPYYGLRHCVKPGITGWAQINQKYGDTLEDTITKLEYDLYYIKNMAPGLDAVIMFHTAKIMLLLRGAR